MLYLQLHKTSPKKLAPIEMQQGLEVENTDSKEKKFRINCRLLNGRREVCVKFKSDTDKPNIVVYRYRKSYHLKDDDFELILRKNQWRLA